MPSLQILPVSTWWATACQGHIFSALPALFQQHVKRDNPASTNTSDTINYQWFQLVHSFFTSFFFIFVYYCFMSWNFHFWLIWGIFHQCLQWAHWWPTWCSSSINNSNTISASTRNYHDCNTSSLSLSTANDFPGNALWSILLISTYEIQATSLNNTLTELATSH